MKVEICEHCGKPGDYPTCDAPRKSRKPRIERELSDAHSRISTLEAALRDMADTWAHYKKCFEEVGAGDLMTGRAWMLANRAEEKARKVLGDSK